MAIFIAILSFFLLGGLFGFVLELFFRRFVSQKRWVKPGFLVGPFVPLYGFGAAILFSFDAFIPWQSISEWYWLNITIESLVLGAMLTLIELIAGLIFVKGMKIRLWDYSKQWGNFEGLICPLFSFFWLVGAFLYVILLSGSFESMGAWFETNWISLAFPVGFFIGILVIDFAYSCHIVPKLRKAIDDSNFVANWEKAKIVLRDYYRKQKAKQSWLLPFYNKEEKFFEAIREHMDELRKKGEQLKEKAMEALSKKEEDAPKGE